MSVSKPSLRRWPVSYDLNVRREPAPGKLGKESPGRKHCECKGPEAGMSLGAEAREAGFTGRCAEGTKAAEQIRQEREKL